jgi:hypothetical protein
MLYLRRLLLAIKIGAVGPIMHSALSDRLGFVPATLFSTRFREHMSCRVWVIALDDEGYLDLGKTVREIEEDAKYLATRAKSRGQRKVVRSAACTA